ncbi:BPL-N domain-containing protein [Gordonia rubripertincta]|uniref:Biotin-protein ligase N-terminal domain-containing protein n=1 Tax=Gordonia rubripertincta TaxID=36822 RepID=A0ABT4MRT8_GORRU|nr:BPL-N domain-containing protein [Gordonia rubripertincta]MCZ4549703.1 hypothetical protein [Gordonia rubripertincta]
MPVRRQGRSRPFRSTSVRALVATALAALVMVMGCAPATSAPDPKLPLALIYNGPQGCDDCAPSIATLLRNAPHPFRTKYVGPGTGTPLTAATLATASLYVQPGGGQDLESSWDDLKGVADDLRAWISGGGSYLGVCFGGYLAGADPGFDLLPAAVGGYTDTVGATVHNDRDTVVGVTYRGQKRHMYFQDGPAFTVKPNSNAEVLATYPNGIAAIMVAPYGKGKVGVSGPHPEADQSWYDEADLENPDGIRTDIAYELIEKTTGR